MPDDGLEFPFLDVGLSFGFVGNAPAIVAGTLMRRPRPDAPVPHLVFLLAAGSVCLQIDLMSDHLEDHIPPVPMGIIDIAFTAHLPDATGGEGAMIAYGRPIHLDWKGFASEPQPVEAIRLRFDTRTTAASFSPVLRPPRRHAAVE